MAQPKTVLITGVGGYWGTRLATRLATVADLHVIGLDKAPPPKGIKGLDFVQTDVRNPLLADFLHEEKVDAVCHLAFAESDRRSESAFDLNARSLYFLNHGVASLFQREAAKALGHASGGLAFLG